MKSIFVDTSAWLALENKKDRFHSKAMKVNKDLLKSGYRYVTINFVLDETYTGLLIRGGHFAAVDFGERIRKTLTVQLLHVTEDIEEEAWKLFKQYSDKKFSFTDCTSFVMMRQLNLTETFTNDHHFEQMGFAILLKE